MIRELYLNFKWYPQIQLYPFFNQSISPSLSSLLSLSFDSIAHHLNNILSKCLNSTVWQKQSWINLFSPSLYLCHQTLLEKVMKQGRYVPLKIHEYHLQMGSSLLLPLPLCTLTHFSLSLHSVDNVSPTSEEIITFTIKNYFPNSVYPSSYQSFFSLFKLTLSDS